MPESSSHPRAEEYIPAAFERIYAAFLAADTATLDSYLDEGITIWIPPEPQLSFGLAGLNAIRARRQPDAGVNTATSVTVHEMVVDSHQDVAWARHIVVAELAGAQTEVLRVTSVWRRDGSRWVQVHSHEDLLPGVSYPFAVLPETGLTGSASA